MEQNNYDKKLLTSLIFKDIKENQICLKIINKNINKIKADFFNIFDNKEIENEKLIYDLINYTIPDYEREYIPLDINHTESTMRTLSHMKESSSILWIYIEKYIKENYAQELLSLKQSDKVLKNQLIKSNLSNFIKHPLSHIKNKFFSPKDLSI